MKKNTLLCFFPLLLFAIAGCSKEESKNVKFSLLNHISKSPLANCELTIKRLNKRSGDIELTQLKTNSNGEVSTTLDFNNNSVYKVSGIEGIHQINVATYIDEGPRYGMVSPELVVKSSDQEIELLYYLRMYYQLVVTFKDTASSPEFTDVRVSLINENFLDLSLIEYGEDDDESGLYPSPFFSFFHPKKKTCFFVVPNGRSIVSARATLQNGIVVDTSYQIDLPDGINYSIRDTLFLEL